MIYLLTVLGFLAGMIFATFLVKRRVLQALGYHFVVKGYNDQAIQRELDEFTAYLVRGENHIPKPTD